MAKSSDDGNGSNESDEDGEGEITAASHAINDISGPYSIKEKKEPKVEVKHCQGTIKELL